jgi:DNA-binding IclR family transcriptional regulator
MRSGTQSIERGLILLRELASRGALGWRLSDLARRCDIDKGTAHRIMSCLVRERLARQRARDRRYVPGPLLFELSLALPELAAFQAACAAPLARAARRLGTVTFLCLRSGTDFVCAGHAGISPARGLVHEVGMRRPLVMSAGGLAIVVALPPGEARGVIAENMRRVQKSGEVRVKAVERMLRRSQSHGYGVHLGDVVPRVHTFGLAVRDAAGMPFASISAAGSSEGFPQSRQDEVIAALGEEAAAIARIAARLFEEHAALTGE